MCGVAGYVGVIHPGLGEEMASLLRHRGPDEEGETLFPLEGRRAVSLAHTRLSIIDLPGGRQPQTNEDGTVHVIFNGEIFNFQELRRRLEGHGHRFRTLSDTEVIVHLYEEHGTDFVQHLRGMFAVALWDSTRKRLVIVRDRLGVKPLYYSLPESGTVELAFASELKALLRVPGVDRKLDLEALDAYLTYLYVPHPLSIVRGARKLPPAHMLVHEAGTTTITRYWSLPDTRSDPDPSALWDEFQEAVELRLIADVPLGAFLSGGIDSSSILSAATATRPALDTFTIAFPQKEERRYDERNDARTVSRYFGSSHHELLSTIDVRNTLPEIIRHFDEPFGNPTAILVYELSRLAREYVKVALTGDGSDELFAGYPRFRGLALASRYRHIPRPVRALIAAGAHVIPESTSGRHSLRRLREFLVAAPHADLDDVYIQWIGYFASAQRGAFLTADVAAQLREAPPAEAFIRDLFARAPKEDLVNRISFVELQSFLPCNVLEYADKMSMAHGLELRAPFVDHRLVERSFSMPGLEKLSGRTTKAILRAATAPHLPPGPLEKPKRGLNPPMGLWLRRNLGGLIDSHLGPEAVAARGIFRTGAVEQLVRDLRERRRDVSLQVWALIVLEEWFRTYAEAA